MSKPKTAASLLWLRGVKWYVRIQGLDRKWSFQATEFRIEQKAAAEAHRVATQKAIDAKRLQIATGTGPITVRQRTAIYIQGLRDAGHNSVDAYESRMRVHVLDCIITAGVAQPMPFGDLGLADVRRLHILDLLACLVKKGLAPRTVKGAYTILHAMYAEAEEREVIEMIPWKLARGKLPRPRDTWRPLATYTVDEVQLLLTSSVVPPERRMVYALKALAGLRHSEAAAVRWGDYEPAKRPLGALLIARSWNTARKVFKGTKTDVAFFCPVHPALASLLAVWKFKWAEIYGRFPTAADLIVPHVERLTNPRAGIDPDCPETWPLRPLDSTGLAYVMKADLTALGLRVKVSEKRSRGGHDLRAWFTSQAIEDGASQALIELVTHAAPKTVAGGYHRATYAAICGAVAKLNFSVAPTPTPRRSPSRRRATVSQAVSQVPQEPGIAAQF